MPKNTCSPDRVYGSFVQTLFLGLTVLDFTATAGWNEQYSTLTVKLVQDPCTGTRKYLNSSYNWSIATFNGDPGFNNAPVGSAAFFKVEDFEFAGIIQSYNIAEDSSANPILTVTLISPGVILEGTQVIVDGYQGDVGGMPNIINAYGFLESLSQDCPAIGGFGSLSGGFGYSRANGRGVPWLLLKPAIQVLLGGNISSTYSPNGGMLYKNGVGTYGSITSNFYTIDISDLPSVASIDYRISGPNSSLLEIISTVCADAGYEFYVDLLPTKGGIGSITNIIKIRTVSRNNQPALGTISNFISLQNFGTGGPKITQDSIGEELRAEYNSAFLIGAQKRQVYQQANINLIEPYWGTDDAGNLNYADFNGLFPNQWGVTLDVRSLNISLNIPISSTSINVSETALLMTLGDLETFKNWIINVHFSSDLGNYIINDLGINATVRLDPTIGTLGGTPTIDSFPVGGSASKPPDDPALMDLQTLFNWLNAYTSDIYGKKWMVRIPWVCYTIDSETGQYLWSDLPSTEGGWFESNNLLGMNFPSTYTDFFADDTGKIQAILKFADAGSTNLEEIPSDSFVTDGTNIWVKANLIDKWVIKNGYAHALLEISNPVTFKRDDISESYKAITVGEIARLPVVPPSMSVATESPDRSDIVGAAGLPFTNPIAASVPVLSNTQTYGPWLASASVNGKVYAEKDEGLSPWEYGGSVYMNLAANAKITNTITNMQTAERGTVTIAGYPSKQLGISISESPSLMASRNLIVGNSDGIGNYYYINVGGTSQQAAQITNITVNVSAGGITTEYQISSFTPVFGRFSKSNAERLRQIGQQRLQFQRNLRSLQDLRGKLALGTSLSAGRARLRGDAIRSNSPEAHRSSAIMLLGKKYGNRNSVNIPTASMLTFYDDYDNSAMMSLDGLVRPVQKRSGSTDLPKEVIPGSPKDTFQPNYTEAPPPPLIEYYPKTVNTHYLDFLANPGDDLVANKSNSPNSGHNIDSVARGTKSDIGTGLFPIPAAEARGQYGYDYDYRYLALRGPLMLHGWGYDVMGKPVPNAQDDAIDNISVNYLNKSDKFKDGWLQDDRTWPVAPVDLRYDRKRGVWTIPPDFRLLKVVGDPIDPGQYGNVTALNAQDVFDSDGNAITEKTIKIQNITEQTTPSGAEYIAYYSNYDNEYWPIFPGSDGSGSGLQIRDTQGICDISPIITQYTEVIKLDFGSGLYVTGSNAEYEVNVIQQIPVSGLTYNDVYLNGNLVGIPNDNPCHLTISGRGLQITQDYGPCDPYRADAFIWKEAFKLKFYSGLQFEEIGINEYEINAIPKFPLSGGTYSNVLLTGNLSAIKITDEYLNPSCAIVLSGTPLKIVDTSSACDIIENSIGDNEYVDAYKINFGSGLYVTGTDGDYTVHALHHVTISGVEYKDIFFDGNLVGLPGDLEGDCTITISGIPLQIKDTYGQCDSLIPYITDYQDARKLIFGSGLDVTGIGTHEYRIDALPRISIDGLIYTELSITGNLVGIEDEEDPCIYRLSGIPLKIKDSYGNCDIQPNISDYQEALFLNFGSGLFVNGSDGSYNIDAIPLMSTINGFIFTGINFIGNLNAVPGDCILTVSGNTGITSGVEYVCDISCSGSNQIISKKSTLSFDKGILISGSECGESSPSPLRQSATVGYNANITSNQTLPEDVSHFITVNTIVGDILITLPDASAQTAYSTKIVKSAANHNVIIEGIYSETINGESTYSLTHIYESVTLYSDGTNWFIG